MKDPQGSLTRKKRAFGISEKSMTLRAVSVFADPRYADPLTSSMAGFLASIGLKTAPAVLTEAGFLDGLITATNKSFDRST